MITLALGQLVENHASRTAPPCCGGNCVDSFHFVHCGVQTNLQPLQEVRCSTAWSSPPNDITPHPLRGFGGRRPESLSKEEEEKLLKEWEPEPLVPPTAVTNIRPAEHIVERVDGPKLRFEGEDKDKISFVSSDFLAMGSRADVKDIARDVLEEVRMC